MRHLLLPDSCGGCSAPGPSPCRSCWDALRPAPPGVVPPGLDDLVALLSYEGLGREIVARLKYRNQRASLAWLATGVAGLLAGCAEALAAGAATITWAPTTAARHRARGFDQAELLARSVARSMGVRADPLLRRMPGPAQTGRSGAARRTGGPVFLPLGSVPPMAVIIDDVVTSGATLTAAAAALRAGGGQHVVGATAARTPARSV